ncbi:MAG: hypothetical protein K9J16_01030 [Melioribacteraceae bacterium]|nr:hypothetical protein [Melioribacteraceae bacterium]MCF8354009.1 hypothetical protein [Melioribacteraceae bacterium]MCF8392310.1 hypothetical protein [Melioribacteraceae bacterium]MCF8417642.1 hypothetical protein [Melioribacteraceae bacterium]
MKIITTTIFILIFAGSIANAQIKNLSTGASFGVGYLKGNSPSQTAFTSKIFIDFLTFFSKDVSIRMSYLFTKKINYLLPENSTGRYYPYMHVFGIQGFIDQIISDAVYIEEGAGIIMLNDRTFSDTDVWNTGASFTIVIGMDLHKNKSNGFSLGAGMDYGITFNNTTASYYSTFLQLQYHF